VIETYYPLNIKPFAVIPAKQPNYLTKNGTSADNMVSGR